MPRRTLWILFAGMVIALACYERADKNPYGRWFAEVMDTVDRHYLEPVDDESLFQAAVNGVIGQLDDYSAYLPHSESEEFRQAIDQQYGGVGLEVLPVGEQGGFTVANPLPDTPAYKAGIHSGDQIVSIDGKTTVGISLREAVRLMRGVPGTVVTIGVRRPDEPGEKQFRLTRAAIKTDSVLGDVREANGKWNFMLPGDDHIGYIRITSFGESTLSEFSAAMHWLTDHKCQALVIDLRNNPGGLLESARAICELFVPKDAVIVSTRGRGGQERARFEANGHGPYQSLPLAVLVNRDSASASEILAAALQDNGRATIVGQRSWGKGTVQNILPMEGGKSSLKLTVGTYSRPSGKNIHRSKTSEVNDEWGVSPDEGFDEALTDEQQLNWLEKRRRRDALRPDKSATAEEPESPLEFDPQLQRAVEALEVGVDAKPAATAS